MPSSYYQNIPAIMDIVVKLKPQSVLDVGPGYGKYGFLIREYLDDFVKPTMRIDAIDIYPYYAQVSGQYDVYIYGDFLDDGEPMDFLQPQYDLVLLIDVIEHFTKEDAQDVLAKAIKMGKHVLISTPHGFMKQGPRNGNEHEAHLSGWEADELPGTDYSTEHSIIKLI